MTRISSRRRAARPLCAWPLVVGLAGCAQMPPQILPPRPQPPMTAAAVAEAASAAASAPLAEAAAAAAQANAATPEVTTADGGRLFQVPKPPPPRRSATTPPATGQPTEDPALEAAVALDQLPLPVFIDTVFGSILKRNVSMDPSIAQRKELVSLKTGKPQSAAALFDAARAVLRSYGLAVTEFNGLVRITPAAGATGYLPEIRRGRALPDVPASLRPVFHLVELESVSPANVSNLLRTVFGQRVTVQDDLARQAVLLSGQSDDVAAALEAIQVLDQPSMRGRTSARIAPLFWSADELARRLNEILTAEGYAVGAAANAQAPVILLPVSPLNSVIVFAASDAVLNHVLRWSVELDRPASGRGSAGYFTYAVRNLDAADLAKTLQEVMNPVQGAQPTPGGVRSRVVVNPTSNTLIIQGNPTEYQQWFGLLQELDRPPRTALVSVTVAEVRLTNQQQLGFEWLLNEFKVGGYRVNLSTLGAFGAATIGGLSATINSTTSSARALLNVLASTQRVRVLANPSVMARNGETAFIQVGSEVPVVTSQQSTNTSGTVPGGALQPNILQTIQYRSTGVILRVKPVIHSGGRIDLDVEQEVSSAAATRTGVSASPTIATRRVNTKLSVTDGSTVLLGGLMQETATNADTGVPLLKDIPVAGHLFKSSDEGRDRTELVVLITPYVISDEHEANAISEAFRGQFGWDAGTPAQQLRPPHERATSERPPAAPTREPSAPYALPPPGAESTPQAVTPPVPPGAGVARPQQPPPDIPQVPRSPIQPPTAPPSSAAPRPAPQPPAHRSGAGTGVPVEDEQLKRELDEALKRR